MNLRRILCMLLIVAMILPVIPVMASADATVHAGDSFTYTPAEHWGVNNGIWSWQWALANTKNFSDMTFTTVDGQGDCYVADWDVYPYCAARKEGINIHPNESADSARVFTAPASGWVTVSASVARATAYETSAAKSPTSFRILLENTTIYPKKGEYQILTSTEAEKITCNIFVKEGEKLRFVVGAMDNHSSDAVNLQTTIRYDTVVSNPDEICRIGESFTFSSTEETWGQPDPHWSWEWTPAGTTSFSPMTYQYLEKYSKYMYASDWTANPYNYVDQLGVKMHPAAAVDTVKTFTAPYTGTVKLDTEISRFVNLSDVTTTGANGTSLRILVNDTQVYPLYSDVLVVKTTTAKNFSVSLSVTAGDQIRFVIGSMGQVSSDAVRMYNTVTYTSVAKPSICVDDGETSVLNADQWANNQMGNWSFEWHDADDNFGPLTYQYLEKYGRYMYASDWTAYPYQYADQLGVKIHPAVERDTVKTYTVPYDGRIEMQVAVARVTEYVAEGSKTPTSLCIYKNDQQIWPTNGSVKEITSAAEVTYAVSADVRAGDKIRCVVGSVGNNSTDAITMNNTVTYRAVGTRELVAAMDQYNQRIDVIDAWGDNLDSAETAWSWKPTTALGYSSLDTYNSPTDAKIRYVQADRKYVVAVCSSRGFMGVVDFATGKKIWQVSLTDGANPHSIEYLPNGNVAVAASKGNWIRIYTSSQGKSSSTYAEVTLEGAHGVLWDPDRKILWGLGYDTFTAYQIGGTAAKPTIKELKDYRVAMPNVSAGGHDLAPVYGNKDKLWITSESLYEYDIATKTFSLSYDYAEAVARKGIKGVSIFPDTNTLVHVYPNNTYLTHDSDRYYITTIQNGKFFGVTHNHSTGAYYKVRSFIPYYNTEPRDIVNPETPEHNFTTTVVAPTCVSDGYTTYCCTDCGYTYQGDPVTAKGHSYQAQVVAPDCVNGGYTVYTCSECGDSYQSDTVSAAGHSYHSVVTPATCIKEGYTTYTCAICGDSYQDNFTPIVVHDYHCTITAPTCTTGGHTTYKCIVCGDTYDGNYTDPTGHSYENGSCVSCGEPDPNAVKVPALALKYPSLNLEDMVVINVYFTAENLDDVVEMGLITYSYDTEDVGIHSAESVIRGYTYSEETGMYSVSSSGIAAKEMGDTVWFAVYAKTKDGQYTYTRLVTYSPMEYAYNQLTRGNEDNQKLSVALLNYGAAAQIYFNYKTDSLMNKDLTDVQRGLIDSYRSDMIVSSAAPTAEKTINFVKNGGYVRCYPSIVLEGAFAINYHYIPSYTPVGDVLMYVWDQDTYNCVDVLTKENASSVVKLQPGETYSGVVSGIAAKDLDQAVYVTFIYSDGTTEYCAGILNYSIGDYCISKANGTDNTADIAAATAVYSYYAKLIFSGEE